MLKIKDNEITNLKLELQKIRATAEKEYKKVVKAQQSVQNSNNNNLTTGGSGGDYPISTPKLNQTFSFDPYHSARKSNLNHTMVVENPAYLTNRETKLRELTGTYSNNPF